MASGISREAFSRPNSATFGAAAKRAMSGYWSPMSRFTAAVARPFTYRSCQHLPGGRASGGPRSPCEWGRVVRECFFRAVQKTGLAARQHCSFHARDRPTLFGGPACRQAMHWRETAPACVAHGPRVVLNRLKAD